MQENTSNFTWNDNTDGQTHMLMHVKFVIVACIVLLLYYIIYCMCFVLGQGNVCVMTWYITLFLYFPLIATKPLMLYIEARVLRVGLQQMVAVNMKGSCFDLAVQEHTDNNCLKLLSLSTET
jgi:hypothetical protein